MYLTRCETVIQLWYGPLFLYLVCKPLKSLVFDLSFYMNLSVKSLLHGINPVVLIYWFSAQKQLLVYHLWEMSAKATAKRHFDLKMFLQITQACINFYKLKTIFHAYSCQNCFIFYFKWPCIVMLLQTPNWKKAIIFNIPCDTSFE